MKVVCWDFDGTLAYSHCLWSGSIWKALKKSAPDTNITLDDVEPYTATGFTWYTPENDYTKLVGERWWDYMNAYFKKIYISLGVDENTAETASRQVRKFIKEKGNYHLYDDTIPVLEYVKQRGYKNIILSNNFPDLCDVLEKLQLEQYFDDFVISGQIGYDKPRKEIFTYAMKVFSNVEQYYMIGDSVRADIIGGKNAGMTTILVHKQPDVSADYSFQNLTSICDIL